jgi:hypothetical protein
MIRSTKLEAHCWIGSPGIDFHPFRGRVEIQSVPIITKREGNDIGLVIPGDRQPTDLTFLDTC